MKNQSIVFKLATWFLLTYTAYSVVMTVVFMAKGYSDSEKRQLQNESFYLKIGHILLKENEMIDLNDRLGDAIEANQIGFYSIRKGNEDVAFGSAAGISDPIYIPTKNDAVGEYSFEDNGYRYFTVKEGGYQLAIGHKTSFFAYAQEFWRLEQADILKDILFVSIMTLALVVFSFRDFFKILKHFKTAGLKRGDESLATSQETLTLVRGLQGYENKIGALETENLLFKNQVLPALRKELESGKQAPYEFSCSLVRADINNFTQIFANHDRAEFMATINEFFVGVTHIVSRYHGFVHEFIGDEVLFYFKDEDHKNSAAIALSALTDIRELADSIDGQVQDERGYGFKIKSSVAHGILRFGPLVNGYSLAGVPLIETVRMLTHVHERSDNVTLIDQAVQEQTSWLCSSKELGVVMLKGLKGQRRLFQFEERTPLSLHLRQQTNESLQNAHYYRSDEAIAQVLEFLKEQRLNLPDGAAHVLINALKDIPMTSVTSNTVKAAYLSLLEELLEEPRSSLHFLASVVALATTLISAEVFQGRILERFKECLRHHDPRVAANAVEVFGALNPRHQDRIFKAMVEGETTNRILANLLVKEAKVEWNKDINKRLRAMLAGASPFDKASALYALGEITAHFRATDDVAFRTNTQVQALLTKAGDLCFHANAMVRRQAVTALEKAGQLEVLEIKLSDENFTRKQDKTALKDLLARIEVYKDEATSVPAEQDQKPKLKIAR